MIRGVALFAPAAARTSTPAIWAVTCRRSSKHFRVSSMYSAVASSTGWTVHILASHRVFRATRPILSRPPSLRVRRPRPRSRWQPRAPSTSRKPSESAPGSPARSRNQVLHPPAERAAPAQCHNNLGSLGGRIGAGELGTFLNRGDADQRNTSGSLKQPVICLFDRAHAPR